MARFRKGDSKPPNGGRKAGTPNKISKTAKENYDLAFEEIGGHKALAAWAQKHKTDFYRMYSRMLPTKVETIETPKEASPDLSGISEETLRKIASSTVEAESFLRNGQA